VPAALRSLGLPSSAFTGNLPEAVSRRAAILGALGHAVVGFPLEVHLPELAIACGEALEALVAAALAAWVARNKPDTTPSPDAWIPLPPPHP